MQGFPKVLSKAKGKGAYITHRQGSLALRRELRFQYSNIPCK